MGHLDARIMINPGKIFTNMISAEDGEALTTAIREKSSQAAGREFSSDLLSSSMNNGKLKIWLLWLDALRGE